MPELKAGIKLSIIGTGNMGHYLALKLQAAGHSIEQIVSGPNSGGAGLAERVGATPIDDPGHLRPDAACYILAVPDSALQATTGSLPAFIHEKVLIHCAGALPVGMLEAVTPHAAVL